MVVNEIVIEQQLKEAGNRLLDPPSSIDELLDMLDKLECLLINVEQAPSRSIQDALLPSMKALISNALLRNPDADVKLSVASCLSEITRITAPDPPYNDEHMKEICQLIVAAFEKLSHVSSRCYVKAVSILDTVAKVRSCLIMLDLELDDLIVKMFQHFLKIIRSNHPHGVFLAMETIMTLIIDESDDISMGLLTPLLASVTKENQIASPIAWKLGEKVLVNSAAKLKPYLKKAVHCEGRALDEYPPIVASICQDKSHTTVRDHVNGSRDGLVPNEGPSPDAASPGEVLHGADGIPESTSNGIASTRKADNGINDNHTKNLECCSFAQHSESTEAIGNADNEVKSEMEPEALGNADPEVKLEMEPGTVPRKRGWKPNSLMNPEEGYEHCWIPTGRKGTKVPLERKLPDKGIDLRLENPVPKKLNLSSVHVNEPVQLTPQTDVTIGASTTLPDKSLPDESHPKRGRAKKKVSNMNQDVDPSSSQVSKVLNTENEEKASLRKQSEGRSNTEVKLHKHSRKIELAAKSSMETCLPLAFLLSDEKDDVLRESEEKPLHQSTQSGARSKRKESKDSSVVQTDIRKRSLVISISNINVAQEYRIKKTKSSDRDGNKKEEILKKSFKRKRTPRKEVTSETPDLDEQLTGSKIKVWWPKDKTFYEGVVHSYDHIKKKHRVFYADGDVEILNLRKERWELIGDYSLPDKEQVTAMPKADFSSDKPQQEKGKVKSESAKQLKSDLRSVATSTSKRKARTFDGESAGGNTQDELGFVDKASNDTSLPEGVSEGEVKSSSTKLKIKNRRINIKSERLALENANPYAEGSLKDTVYNVNPSGGGSSKGTNESDAGITTPKGDATPKGECSEQPSSRSELQNEVKSVNSDETS